MERIHWCGTGLSSGPGLRRLIAAGHAVSVWTVDEAEARRLLGPEAAAATLRVETPATLQGALGAALGRGDVVVSMLPADLHPALASLAVAHGAHFVSSSYVSAAMQALDMPGREAGVALVNEVGLDPGIDHLMAHDLVTDYRASAAFDPGNVLSFTSYCGGVPAEPNAFRYKFSWSPQGVLRALAAPSRSIRAFSELAVRHPWDAVTRFDAPLPRPETFEVCPNRDSLPYLAQYGFEPGWRVRDFVRGTIRLLGWAEAWAPVFAELAAAGGPEGEARLRALSDRLWRENAYAEGEPDRVLLFVSLKAERDGRPVWAKDWGLDARGDLRGSAMARLVSGPVSLAAEGILQREFHAGVQGAPHDGRVIRRWLDAIGHWTQYLARTDRLRG